MITRLWDMYMVFYRDGVIDGVRQTVNGSL